MGQRTCVLKTSAGHAVKFRLSPRLTSVMIKRRYQADLLDFSNVIEPNGFSCDNERSPYTGVVTQKKENIIGLECESVGRALLKLTARQPSHVSQLLQEASPNQRPESLTRFPQISSNRIENRCCRFIVVKISLKSYKKKISRCLQCANQIYSPIKRTPRDLSLIQR